MPGPITSDQTDPMRIVIHDFGGYPFTVQLARELASRGHAVLYLHAAGFRSPKASLEDRPDDPSTLTIRGVDIGHQFRVGASLQRLMQERRYGSLLAGGVAQHGPDVVISANCPLDAQAKLQRATHRHGAGFVFWMQDLYAHAVGRLLERRLPLVGRLVGFRYARLERQLLTISEGVVCISADFLPTLREWRIPVARTEVIENWAPLDIVTPLPKSNAWAVEQGLANEQVLLYAGTLGRKHDPRLLLALALGIPEAKVVVVSDGVGADRLRRQSDLPTNLRLLPLQPAPRLAEVLATGDVLVALLEADAGQFSVPSKVLTYLTAGRPVLAAIPRTNLAARIIHDAAAGHVVEPGERDAFVAAARTLLRHPDERATAAASAVRYAQEAFAIGPIADRFEHVLRRARRRA